jgi:hypothetical protein
MEFSILQQDENVQLHESLNLDINSTNLLNKNSSSFLNQTNLNRNTFKNIRDHCKIIKKLLSQNFNKKSLKKKKNKSMTSSRIMQNRESTEFSNTNININSNSNNLLIMTHNNSNINSNQNNFSHQIQNNINYTNKKITKEDLVSGNFKFDINEDFFLQYDNDMKNDVYYQAYLEYQKFMQDRKKLLRKINEINIHIPNTIERRSIHSDNISKYESKEISNRLKNLNIKKRPKSNIVLEQDFSFSDDSLDYDIMPVQNNNSHRKDYEKNLDDLIEVISKAKSPSDIDCNLRKKKKNMASLRLMLEKEFKSVLLTIKYLDINKQEK